MKKNNGAIYSKLLIYLFFVFAGVMFASEHLMAADLSLYTEKKPDNAICGNVSFYGTAARTGIVIPLISKIIGADFKEEKNDWQNIVNIRVRKIIPSFDRTKMLIVFENSAYELIEAATGKKLFSEPAGSNNGVLDAKPTPAGFLVHNSSGVYELRASELSKNQIITSGDVTAVSALTAGDGGLWLAVLKEGSFEVYKGGDRGSFKLESKGSGVFTVNDCPFLFYSGPVASSSKPDLAIAFKNQLRIYDISSAAAEEKKQMTLAGNVLSMSGALDPKSGRAFLVAATAAGYAGFDLSGRTALWEIKTSVSKKYNPTVLCSFSSGVMAFACLASGGTRVSVNDIRTGQVLAELPVEGKVLYETVEAVPAESGKGLYLAVPTIDSVQILKFNIDAAFASFYPGPSEFVFEGQTPGPSADKGPSSFPASMNDVRALWETHGSNVLIAFSVLAGLIVLKKAAGVFMKKGGKEVKLSQKDMDAQIKRMKEMLDSTPENIEIILNLINYLKAAKQNEEVVEYYKTLIKLRPVEEIYYEELLNMRPPYFGFVGELVALYKRKAKTKTAISSFEEKIRKVPEGDSPDIAVLRILARLYIEDKRPKDAVEKLESAVKASPDSIEDLMLLADCLSQSEEFERAAEVYKKLLSVDKSHNVVNHYIKLFQLNYKMALHEDAVEIFRIAMETKNAALEALLPHANGYFDEAVRLGNKKVILLYGGCVIDSYNKQKNVNAAIAAIDKVLAIFPKEKSLLKKKAFLLLEKGEEANIIEIFKELYESNPNDIKIKTEYCRLLQKVKKTDECIDIILDALKKNETIEKFTEIFINLCGDVIKARQFPKVLESAGQVYEITKSFGVLQVMAEACLKSGDIDRAHDIYTKLSGEAPDPEPFSKRLKYVRSLIEERKLAEMKNEGAESITLLIDGEKVAVKALDSGGGERQAANPIEIKMAEAKLYFERSEYRKAIPVLQELSKLLEGKKEGLIVQVYLITCFLRENLSAAAEKIYDSIDPVKLGLSAKEELSFKYKCAGLFEDGRDLKKAEAVFSDVISIDMGYRDAGDRLNGIKEKIAQASAMSARAAASAVEDDSEKTTIGMVLTEVDYIDKRYEVISQLGKGGMGIVFKAKDTAGNRDVAIKIPILSFKDDKGFMDRFEREASVLKKLKHPNIMNIFSVEGKELPYIVMEILTGRSLKEIIKEKKIISSGETRDLAVQCCDALAYTHGLNIVHRDIKPENIMVIKDNVVKIMDFGLAKALDESTVTKAGTILGTFAYISPEQAMGGAVDGRADIYSLGVMFYEMLAGEKPFTSGDFVHQHLKVKPVPPTKKNGKIPYQVEAIVLKCLEKEPSNRFKNMEELKEAWTKIV